MKKNSWNGRSEPQLGKVLILRNELIWKIFTENLLCARKYGYNYKQAKQNLKFIVKLGLQTITHDPVRGLFWENQFDNKNDIELSSPFLQNTQ